MTRIQSVSIAWLFMFTCSVGCSSFLHFSDPGAQAVVCGITGGVLRQIEAIAADLGFPVAVIEALYTSSCRVAVENGADADEAQQLGLKRAREQGLALKRLGARFTEAK